MYVTIAVLVSVFVMFSALRVFFNRNWKLIYSTFGSEEYFKIIAKLNAAGITYKTKYPLGLAVRTDRFNDNTQYDIYVKRDEEHRAIGAIHKNS